MGQVNHGLPGSRFKHYEEHLPAGRRATHAEQPNQLRWMKWRQTVRKLPVRQRAVILLRYFEDRTEAETAEILGLKVGTVKSHAFRALSALRAVLPDLNELSTEKGAAR